MPVPKRKRSRARRDSRFANKGLKLKAIAKCNQCSGPLMPHQACSGCGFYKGAKVMATKADRGVKRQEIRAKQKSKPQESSSESA
jgi:large subunit ribosomal protein L32